MTETDAHSIKQSATHPFPSLESLSFLLCFHSSELSQAALPSTHHRLSFSSSTAPVRQAVIRCTDKLAYLHSVRFGVVETSFTQLQRGSLHTNNEYCASISVLAHVTATPGNRMQLPLEPSASEPIRAIPLEWLRTAPLGLFNGCKTTASMISWHQLQQHHLIA